MIISLLKFNIGNIFFVYLLVIFIVYIFLMWYICMLYMNFLVGIFLYVWIEDGEIITFLSCLNFLKYVYI